MTIKLFTIGDSVSQGFMSGAAANAELSYSTILAQVLGINDYRYLQWEPDLKLKYDLEKILRTLEKAYGIDIRGLEWLGVLSKINHVFDQSEDYFERGDGRIGKPLNLSDDSFHNVAVEGMNVGDAWMVTPELSRNIVNSVSRNDKKDGFLDVASKPFYRNAYRILNPNSKPEYMKSSAISWLKHHAEESGIDNVILWLGANNALGTIVTLKIHQTNGDGKTALNEKQEERQNKWNLWHPDDFQAEYTILLNKVVEALAKNKNNQWHCFVATIPLITIAPIIKGVGEARIIKDPEGSGRDFRYYQYYTYFPLSQELGLKGKLYLKFRDALFIDKTIIQFNQSIKKLVEEKNTQLGRAAFHIVDIAQVLTDMAWKRNSGNPIYDFPDYLDWLYPPVDTKYYHVDTLGNIEKGGIFSLDGIHPSAIGQGIIAWEFLKKMQSVGQAPQKLQIDWKKIVKSDTLRQKPIKLMHELYENQKLLQFIVDILPLIDRQN